MSVQIITSRHTVNRLSDFQVDMVLEKDGVLYMPASFVMAFYVGEWSCEDAYVASRLDGQTTNCEISGSVISVYFNSPGFPLGQLKCRVFDSVDNAAFTDGTLDTCTPLTLPIEIVATAGDSEVISLYTDGYQPPATGIPKGDLEQSVQDTLDSVANKVDKEQGKGLSTNDYTTAEKQKLAGLSNYNDSALQTAVNNLQTALANVYTKAQTDDAIQEAVDGLGGGSVESVTVNGVNHTPVNGIVDLGTIQGAKGDKGEKGDTVVIDPEGLAQFEIANDLDTSDPTQGLSARQGKILKQAISTVQANLQAVVDALANMAFTSAKPTLSQIDWTGGTFYATVVKNLSGCTATDNTTNGQIVEGQTLTMQLTANNGFTLTGATISVTNSKGQAVAYTLNGSTLTVANVTGTITVSVVAVGVFSVVNNDTNVNLTANTMSPTSGSSWTGTLAIKSGISNYRLASAPVVTMGGTAVDFSATGNSWNSSTGVMTIGSVTGNIVIASASVEMVAHRVANHFINMASTGDGYVEDGDDYTAVLSPTTGATSNGDLRVFVDGTPLESTDYTFDSATGALTIPAAKITGDVDVCATASTGKITVTVKAGMSTTVEFKQDQWKAAFYSDTIDASESAEDVTVVIDTVPKVNGIPTVTMWTFGTKEAIKSIDFGGCKTFASGNHSKFDGLSGAESITGLAYVETPNNAAVQIAYFFNNCSSLQGTLDLMTWRCDTGTANTKIFNNCTADEIIMPYMPGLTQFNGDLTGSKVKRVIYNKTGTITQFRQLFGGATLLEYVDISKCPVHIGTGTYDWYKVEESDTNTFTLKIGEFEMDINDASGGLTHVGKLICTTKTPPGAIILSALSADVQIYVPNNAVDAYKTAWSSKASNIHPVSEYTE